MNKHFLKTIRDNIPEPLKYLTARLFRNKLIKNKDYSYYKNLLTERESLNEVAIKAYQFNKLKETLIYSYKYVPYYTKLFDKVGFQPYRMNSPEEISIIPFLTKELIRNNFDLLISTKKVPKGYYIATTGGSSGEPLKVLLDYTSIFKTIAFVYHYRKKIGYQESNRLATFRGIEFDDKLWKYNPMYKELVFSPFKLSKLTIKEYLKKMNEHKPDYLNGYLSALYYFARLLSEDNLKLEFKLKGIFLISENIDSIQRQFLEDFFEVKSSTFYGHSESCILAEEIMPNEYVFDPYYGYTELIPMEDSSLSISGTGFLNRTMPLIRYRTDDICFPLNKSYTIDGRWKSKMGLHGYNDEFLAHAAFNFHSEIFKNVTNYQFVQTQKGKVDLLLIVNEKFQADEIEMIKKEINRKAKGVIDFNIIKTNKLILSKRGKYKMFMVDIKD